MFAHKVIICITFSVLLVACFGDIKENEWMHMMTDLGYNDNNLSLAQFKSFLSSLQCHHDNHQDHHHDNHQDHHHDNHQDHHHDNHQDHHHDHHGSEDHHQDHKDSANCSLYNILNKKYNIQNLSTTIPNNTNNNTTNNNTTTLTYNNINTMCMSILHHLSLHNNNQSSPCHHHHHHTDDDDDDFGSTNSLYTWGYAIAACIIISLVGLVAVAIIPLMHRVVYNHVLQFLVAMAIGSMSGDALLHLIPHAFIPHDHGHSDHGHKHSGHSNHDHHVWLGLMALGGIFIFFVVERFVGICSERKRMRNKDRKYSEEKQGGMLPDQSGDRKEIGTPLQQQNNNLPGSRAKAPEQTSNSCEQMLMVVHASKDIKKMASDAEEDFHKNCDPDATNHHTNPIHNHSQHHHSHTAPGSVAAVAWMVIVGDGFHNFADGLAIGSAFSSSVQDGLSTSIAVFCHELPHELGDFAMLLSAGMSGKQALIYNCVSSVLCIVGMCVGVLMGGLVRATPWIFMLIAGMFLYIALVDMLPEMKSVTPKRGEHPFLHLGLQVAGWIVGSSIMLLIALFEDKISI